MTLGSRIRELRKSKQMTQEELGKVLKVSKVSISGYENGTREPDTQGLSTLANFFDVSTDYLLGNTNNKHTISSPESDDILTMYKIDTRGLTEDEIDDMREELEEYNDFMTKRLQEKIAKKKRK